MGIELHEKTTTDGKAASLTKLLLSQCDCGCQKDDATSCLGVKQLPSKLYHNPGFACACGKHYDVIANLCCLNKPLLEVTQWRSSSRRHLFCCCPATSHQTKNLHSVSISAVVRLIVVQQVCRDEAYCALGLAEAYKL